MLLALLIGCAHHIADPGPLVPLPDGAPPAPALRICWVEFATGHLPRGFAVAHHALHETPPSTQSGLVFVHPSGTWLVDGGSAADVAGHIHDVHGLARFVLNQANAGFTAVATPATALARVGVDPTELTGVIPTHGHFDHLGGLLDLPGVPVWLPAAEIEAAGRPGPPVVLPAEARALQDRAHPLAFEGPPFLLWPASHDLFGDGSVVLVPLPGHTPGSLGVRVRLPDGRAVLLVGDTVWVREGYEAREPKGSIAAAFDADGAQNDLQIARLWALHRADPSLILLPAHDRRQWEAAFGEPGCVGG